MSHIYFIMWVSWAWKWTLIKNIKNLHLSNIHIPLSYKTRSIRENEINWIDANFISKEVFFSQVQKWEFLEYAIVHETDYYGTKFEDVIDNWINLWKIVLKELDINWLEELKKTNPELDKHYKTIFLNIPNDILKQRIEARGVFMSNEELERRINSRVQEERKAKKLCDYIIDATLKEEGVLKEVLKIMNLNSNIIDNIINEFELNNFFDISDLDFNIISEWWEIIIKFLVENSWEIIWEFIWWVFSNIDL